MKRVIVPVLSVSWMATVRLAAAISFQTDGYHVHPGDRIQPAVQPAVQPAAANTTNEFVKVHAGEDRPEARRQALVWRIGQPMPAVTKTSSGQSALKSARVEVSSLSDGSEEIGPAVP